jgi:Bacterial regulatory proteins, luxR family
LLALLTSMQTATGQGVLETLGVGADAEHVYRVLLKNPGGSTTDIRERTALGPRRLKRALDELERKAMIARRSGVPARFQPAPPDIVVEALISAREDELSQARLDALQLTTSLYAPPEQPEVADLIEVLTTREAVAERWLQMQRVTRERIEVFVRPPYAQEPVEEDEAVQRLLHERGVMTFALYDEGALRSAGTLDHIRRMTALGEHARVVSRLPLKLAVFDRRVALVPVSHSDAESTVDAGLLVHKSALLDALIGLFDIYWQRGAEVSLGQDESASKRSAADEDSVLTLLAAGLKDETIARQLGVSTHTVRRRIAAVLERMGVTTRFQAGLALGSQGWPQGTRADGEAEGRHRTERR